MLTKTDDDSFTLYSAQYEQTYHSSFGAVAESRHVFLHGAGVFERLSQGQTTHILEIGFGLGLNCLLSADHANQQQTHLHYTGVEHAPISAEVFAQLGYGNCLKYPQLNHDLLQVFTNLAQSSRHILNSETSICAEENPNTEVLLKHEIGEFTQLKLIIDEATRALSGDSIGQNRQFDAIYLDAFSPENNPECWTQAFFERLAQLITPHGRLATYCVKGVVRRNLESAGFKVHKYPGPIGKREVLWAHLNSPNA